MIFFRSLHRAALNMNTEVSDDGNYFLHCQLACPAIILAQLSLVRCDEGQGVNSAGSKR